MTEESAARPAAPRAVTDVPILELQHITKRFPGVLADDDVSLSVFAGQVVALLGENGAGKTTLMNVVYGLLDAEEGRVLVAGKEAAIKGPRQAIDLGIGMVHQHFMLVQPLTVTENIVLGLEPTRLGVIQRDVARRKVLEISARYGLKVDPDAHVEDLSVGMQQRVEILKALYRDARMLILDEPTAVLTPQEVDELFAIVRQLVDEGLAVVIITHKLDEVMAFADRIIVMRAGRLVGETAPSQTDEAGLAKMMVGRDVVLRVEKPAAHPGDVVLEVDSLEAVDDRKLPAVRGISFSVRAGEIVGIAGVDGNGQRELVESIVGLRRPQAGSVTLRGRDITHSSAAATIEAGVSFIPEDRQRRGLVLDFDLVENLVLGDQHRAPISRFGILNRTAMAQLAEQRVADYDVRTPSTRVAAANLSGGNQQKLVVAREIGRDPDVLVAAQPTRGLDVGAIEFVHRQIISERQRGKAVLLVSMELEEVLSLSDRILVIYEGSIVAEFESGTVNEEQLGYFMTGGGKQDADKAANSSTSDAGTEGV
jgi:general nucleoside transport system ATP-binding protein